MPFVTRKMIQFVFVNVEAPLSASLASGDEVIRHYVANPSPLSFEKVWEIKRLHEDENEMVDPTRFEIQVRYCAYAMDTHAHGARLELRDAIVAY